MRCYFHMLALEGLGWQSRGGMQKIRDAGYEGVQFVEPLPESQLEEALSLGLGVCGSGRVFTAADVMRLAAEARLAGLECLSLIVGTGLEEDDDAVRLIEAVLNASAKHSVPLYVETRRSSLFQDMWRAVSFHRRFPALEFNADLSHWYTGQQMGDSGFEQKFRFIQPVLQCARFVHGRIGDAGSMQVALDDANPEPEYVAHFRTMWIDVFEQFLRAEHTRQKFMTFAVELLDPVSSYARTFQGREESDRWEQSLRLCTIARECFQAAQARARAQVHATMPHRTRRTA